MAQSNHTTSVVVGDDLVPRFSFATTEDLRNVALILSDPAAHGLSGSHSAAALLATDARGDAEGLAAAYAAIRPLACIAPGRLFPSGRLVGLSDPGGPAPRALAQGDVDELRISADMASSHMPRRYLLAVQAVAHEGGAARL